MKKRLCAFLLMLCVLTISFPCFQAVAEEATYTNAVTMTELTKVTDGGVYSISTSDEFFAFAEKCTEANDYFENATVILTADIDLNPGWTAGEAAPAKVWTPIALFKGDFDGQGHTVKGIYAGNASSEKSGKSEDTTGLFAAVWGNVTIQNLTIENAYFTANRNASALIGFTSVDGVSDRKINIKNVSIDAQVVSASDYAAGFIAQVFGDWNINAVITFDSCIFRGSVTAEKNGAAGFVALPYRYMTFQDCVFAGAVTGDNFVAGFIAKEQGYSWYAVNFNRCASVGTLNTSYDFGGANNTGVYVAGYVAESANELVFTDCLSNATFPYSATSYTTSGYIGHLTTFKATFYRCVNRSHALNPTHYFNAFWVGKIDAKTGNTSNSAIYAEDCFAESNFFTDTSGSKRESCGVGMYAAANTASEWICELNYTVRSPYSDKAYYVKYDHEEKKFANDWAYLTQPNLYWLRRSTLPKDVELVNTTALFYLAAFDFAETWTLAGDDYSPMPQKAAELLYGQKSASDVGLDFYGYQTKTVTQTVSETDAATGEGTEKESTTLSLRLIATVDSIYNYDSVGFRVNAIHATNKISTGTTYGLTEKTRGNLDITATNFNKTLANNIVFSTLTAESYTENGVEVQDISVENNWLAAWNIHEIPANGTAIFEVQTYALSGEVEALGDTYVILISDGAVVSVYLK